MLRLSLIAMSVLLYCLSVNGQYKVSTWYQNKPSAITYTFDGYQNTGSNQISVAIPLFDAYNYKTTMTIITDWVTDYGDLIKTAKNGHEMASLTVTHNSLAGKSDEVQEHELSESQRLINQNIPGANCMSLAFPYCETGNMELVKKYYFNGRICSGVIEPATPADLYKISSIITGSEGAVNTSDAMNAKVDLAQSSQGWCVFLIHGIDGDLGYSPLASRQLRKHLAYVNQNDSLFWVGTFGNVVRYIRERNAATIAEQQISTDSLKVLVTDNLPNNLYNHPLTITRPLPEGWTSAAVYNQFKQVTSTVAVINGANTVVFEAIPDVDTIYLAKRTAPTTTITTHPSHPVKVYPNPFAQSITLEQEGNFNYQVYALNGELVLNGNGQNSVTFGKELGVGSYIVKIQAAGIDKIVKIVKTN